jgi:hypothetical protein
MIRIRAISRRGRYYGNNSFWDKKIRVKKLFFCEFSALSPKVAPSGCAPAIGGQVCGETLPAVSAVSACHAPPHGL